MERKVLGKIESAEFGKIHDYPMYMGLLLKFSFNKSAHVGDGGKYTVNMDKACRWDAEDRRLEIEERADAVYKLLGDAKVGSISQLKNKPVEITLEDNTFKDFRILTEVL